MKILCFLGYICIHFLLTSSSDKRTFYISGPNEVKDCTFEGYVPGGKVINVGKIEAPVAEMAAKGISSILGPLSQSSTLAMHSLKFTQEMFSIFKKTSPALGPALGVFGAATGILKSMNEPKAEDILNAANTAIVELTKDMNNKLEDMTGYVDSQVITAEKELIERDYRSNFNLLTHCTTEPSISLSNECQRDTYKDITSSLPKFAVFDTKLVNEHPVALTTMEAKKLEAYLIAFRNYADLLVLAATPLIRIYKNDETPDGRGYYKKYSDDLKSRAEFFIKYAKAAVAAIEKMHDGTDHAGACPTTFECGSIEKIKEGTWFLKVNTADRATCTCVVDDGTKQRCSISATIRKDWKPVYTVYRYDIATFDEALKEFARRILVNTYAKPLISEENEVIKAYWKKELLDTAVPAWEKAVEFALPGTQVKVPEDAKVSDDFSPRYKYRKEFARLYANFF